MTGAATRREESLSSSSRTGEQLTARDCSSGDIVQVRPQEAELWVVLGQGVDHTRRRHQAFCGDRAQVHDFAGLGVEDPLVLEGPDGPLEGRLVAPGHTRAAEAQALAGLRHSCHVRMPVNLRPRSRPGTQLRFATLSRLEKAGNDPDVGELWMLTLTKVRHLRICW